MSFGGHTARKRFGQHWLRDERVLDSIRGAAELQDDDRVLEVGPGRGALTARLRSPAAAVHAVELDRDLVAGLKERLVPFVTGRCSGHSRSLTADAEVMANIPYNITGPLLERLIGRLDRPVDPPYGSLVLLVQQEVARFVPVPDTPVSVRSACACSCWRAAKASAQCLPLLSAPSESAVGSDPLGSSACGSAPAPELCRRVETLLKQAFWPAQCSGTRLEDCCLRTNCRSWRPQQASMFSRDLRKWPLSAGGSGQGFESSRFRCVSFMTAPVCVRPGQDQPSPRSARVAKRWLPRVGHGHAEHRSGG